MSNEPIRLTFCGGVSTVTGANFLLEVGPRKILVDCGLLQGVEYADAINREPFPYDPADIEALFITHAHMDHIGRIGKLVKDGFRGQIYSTPATKDLVRPMLQDALRILDEEARHRGVLPLYETADVELALSRWQGIEYHSPFDLNGITVYPKDSGHILGSAMFEFTFPLRQAQGKPPMKIVFTGDLGNSPSLFLRDTDVVTDATYLVMESVYGDRNHEAKEERRQKLTEIVQDVVKRKRTLIIPAFSLERTQDMLYELNKLSEEGRISDVRVFVDSPLATKVTEIYKRYTSDFKESARAHIAEGDDLFNFPKLKFTEDRRDSEKIDHTAPPKIILAGSGMSNGGRIVRHEKRYLPNKDATILLVGYQTLGTLGRQILDGAKHVTIDGESIEVRAEVKSIMGYSSHKDSDHLIDFVSASAKTLKKVFVTMGEPKAALFLVQRLRDYLGVNAGYPEKGESVEL